MLRRIITPDAFLCAGIVRNVCPIPVFSRSFCTAGPSFVKAGTVAVRPVVNDPRLHTMGGLRFPKPQPIGAPEWAAREKLWIKELVKNPVDNFASLQGRISQPNGMMAPFPELKPVVEQLRVKLSALTPFAHKTVEESPSMQRLREIALHKLVQVALRFWVDAKGYPYPPPFEYPYPYHPTISAIRSAVEFFDAIAAADPAQHALPLYHHDRYGEYLDSLMLDTSTVIVPTMCTLGFEDLIRLRAAPLGLLGVVTETTFVDRHRNSPLDFLAHDANHVRRMNGYTRKALEAKLQHADRASSRYASESRGSAEDAVKVYAQHQKFIQES